MPSQETRIFSEFDDEDNLDAVNHFDETHSITDSDSSFVSDQPGPGRTLDKALSIMGRHLENALSSISERFGNGPNAAMDHFLVAVGHTLHSRYRWFDRPVRSCKFLRCPPPLSQLLEDVFIDSHFWDVAQICEDRSIVDLCKGLISYLRSDKSGNQLLATYYLTALACCNPGIIPHLVQLGALKALSAVHLQQLLLPKGDQAGSFLLASSRRALVMFSDSTALPVIKEFHLVVDKSRCQREDTCDLSTHSCQLLSDLLGLSLNPETQILVAHHLSSNMGDIFYTNNADILQPKLSLAILAAWVDLALSADPVCSAAFRSLIVRLLVDSVYSSTNDAVLSLFVSLLQRKTQGGNSEFVNFILGGHGRYRYKPNRPTSKPDITHLKQILSQSAHLNHLSISTETFSMLQEIASPSQEMWSTFCRHWTFPGVPPFNLDSIHLRSISSPLRIQLCHHLLSLILHGECSLADIYQIASYDIECHKTLIHLLAKSTTTSEAEADCIATLHETLFSRSTPPLHSLLKNKVRNQWCTGIYQESSTSTSNQSTHSKVMIGHYQYDGYYIEHLGLRSLPAPELLLGHRTSLHWTPVFDFLTQENHQNPVRVTGDGHGRDTFIAGIPSHLRGQVGIFAIGSDLVVPEEWASFSIEQLHILTGCSFNGQLAEVYWYNCGQHRCTNAFTMEECDTLEWIKSAGRGCFECCE
ncbi:hypothetical protein JAAARDRAFT_36608 [Jaapia argillacea MUCL 33604]|uniref:Uncharacterized protein n=1 Tax=Jaapia argillacea MUCL 33604 TaxID=933084 RepID=A0A067PNS7_9AGAM|nr:hypothetical protein JAAARDRAFT_36608 [Jaapia argillacea MUCL 33604]